MDVESKITAGSGKSTKDKTMECFLAVFDCAVLGFVRTGQSSPKHKLDGWIAGLGLSVLAEL